jgi:hypothetical protein
MAATLIAAATVMVLPAAASAAVPDTYADDSGNDTLPAPMPGDPDIPNDCSSAATPCKTIQLAIDNVDMGGLVHVGGTVTAYQENLTLDGGKRLEADTSFVTGDSGQVTIDGESDCTVPAISITGSASEIRGLVVTTASATCPSQVGIDTTGPGTLIERTLVKGFDIGINAHGFTMLSSDLPLDLESDVISSSTTDGIAASSANVSATNVTIVGAAQDIALTGANLTLDSTLLTGTAAVSADGTSTCSATYSPTPGPITDCATISPVAAPGFDGSDPEGFHLAAGSAMIDVGNTAAPPVGALDFDGDPRAIDGKLDCTSNVRRDIGADELVPTGAPPPCPPPPPPTDGTSADRDDNQMFLKLSGPVGGNYVLCVQGPMRRDCHGFNATSSHGVFRDTVSWGESFGTQGPGGYLVSWLRPGTGRPIGPARSFSWGVCPPRNQTMEGVWKPARLIVIDPCRTITVKITKPNYYSSNDHDIHLGLSGGHPARIEVLERDRGHLRRGAGHRRRHHRRHRVGPPDPHQGQRIRATGVYVCDTFHGPVGDFEMHPPFQLQILRGHRVVSNRISGPQYPGTPTVHLNQSGRFHCA